MNFRLLKGHSLKILVLVTCLQASSCYFVNFFKKEKDNDTGGDTLSGTVLGGSIGTKAGNVDDAALASVHAVTTTYAPAVIRPDPDIYIRQLLRQYRPEGATIARQIGSVEAFRLLLGGASEDFSKMPQEQYDATSLLATFAVAERVCTGLVAPNAWEHPGWTSILPAAASEIQQNILYLAQRFMGKPSTKISSSTLAALTNILNTEEAALDADDLQANPYLRYVSVCATLALDAEALFL